MNIDKDRLEEFLKIDPSTVNQEKLKAFKEKLFQISDELSKEDFPIIKTIYIDLNMIQEINIGTLLLHVENEDEYNLVLSKIPNYINRIDDKICHHFGKLTINEDDIFKFQQNKSNAINLYKVSPHTSLYFSLPIIINDIKEMNKIGGHIGGIELCINTYPIEFPEYILDIINISLNKLLNSKVKLKIITKHFYELSDTALSMFDMFYVNDIGQWFSNERLCKLLCEKKMFETKKFFSRKVMSIIHDEPVDIESMFIRSDGVCNLFCEFEYINISIPSE